MKPRVIFINRCYAPSAEATGQLLTDLATGLAARGVAVSVLTTHPAPNTPAEETLAGVKIRRLGAGPRGLAPGGRLGSWWRFHRAVRQVLPAMVRAGDTVVCLTDPPLIGATVAKVAAARGVRLIHWVQDIYPELLAAAGSRVMAPLVGMLRPARDHAWRQAHACVTLAEDMAERVRRAGVEAARVRVMPNWAPAADYHPTRAQVDAVRRRWGVGDRLAVVYSGNLGRVHDLVPCLEAIQRTRLPRGLWFGFIGYGAQRDALRQEARRRCLEERVSFLPPTPRAELAASLVAGDVHWVTLRASCAGLVFPSKLYGVAAAGRPVLGVAPRGSSLAQEITGHGLGVCYGREEPAALAAQLLRWLEAPDSLSPFQAAARRYSLAQGGATQAGTDWLKLLFPAGYDESSLYPDPS